MMITVYKEENEKSIFTQIKCLYQKQQQQQHRNTWTQILNIA